jgi:hypothetical protein
MVSSQAASSSRESAVADEAVRPALTGTKAAASATQTSLTAIDSVLVRRDFCERTSAADRISANPSKAARATMTPTFPSGSPLSPYQPKRKHLAVISNNNGLPLPAQAPLPFDNWNLLPE